MDGAVAEDKCGRMTPAFPEGPSVAPSDDLGVSLNLGKHASAKRIEGRSKNFKGLDTVWNNKYFQALDASTGEPLLENVIKGRYYLENTYLRPSSAASNAKGVVIDHHTGMPLIKSLMEGGFYMPREPRLKKPGKIDFIAHNRKMTREYRSTLFRYACS